MTHNEMLTVIAAQRDGKKVHAKYKRSSAEWFPISASETFNFHDYDYRVKPEPREFWINEYRGDFPSVHNTKVRADNASYATDRIACTHVREVLE